MFVVGLLVALVLGGILASGVAPDLLQDSWRDLRVMLRRYHLTSGTTGVVVLMLAGYLLAHGVFLVLRNLWTGVLRSLRERVATIDGARDALTGLPNKFALTSYLERGFDWAQKDPSTNHVSVGLFKIHGLHRVNKRGGYLSGDELLRKVSFWVHEAALSRALLGLARRWTRARLGPSAIMFASPMPPRCPARFAGATFAMGMCGQDPRDAYLYVGELVSLWQEQLDKLQPDAKLKVAASLSVRSTSTATHELLDGARQALAVSVESGEVVVCMSMTDGGSAAMVTEYKDARRIEMPVHQWERDEVTSAPVTPPRPDVAQQVVSAAKTWGLAALFLAATPILISVGYGDDAVGKIYPWPDKVQAVPVVDASQVRNIPLLRSAAGPTSDGVLEVRARLIQMQTSTTYSSVSPNIAQVWLEVTNHSEDAQHLNMFDVTAVDRKGRRLGVDEAPSLRFPKVLDYRTLEPEEKWSGWLRFIQIDTPIKAIIVEPSRRSKVYLGFK